MRVLRILACSDFSVAELSYWRISLPSPVREELPSRRQERRRPLTWRGLTLCIASKVGRDSSLSRQHFRWLYEGFRHGKFTEWYLSTHPSQRERITRNPRPTMPSAWAAHIRERFAIDRLREEIRAAQGWLPIQSCSSRGTWSRDTTVGRVYSECREWDCHKREQMQNIAKPYRDSRNERSRAIWKTWRKQAGKQGKVANIILVYLIW